MNEYYADKCDYRNGDNEDGIHYESCVMCYRYDICMDAYIEKEHPTLLLSSVDEDEYRDVLDVIEQPHKLSR